MWSSSVPVAFQEYNTSFESTEKDDFEFVISNNMCIQVPDDDLVCDAGRTKSLLLKWFCIIMFI